MATWTVFILTLFCMLPRYEQATTGGECYSRAQKSCRDEWTKLIVSQKNIQKGDICRFFGAVHTCTVKYMSNCNFDKHEKELYERDIVRVYTQKPYSCALIGGNLQYRAEYKASGTSQTSASLFMLFLPFQLLINA